MAFMQAPERRAPNVVLHRPFHRSAASKYYSVLLGSSVCTLLLFQTPDLLLTSLCLLQIESLTPDMFLASYFHGERRIRHSHGDYVVPSGSQVATVKMSLLCVTK